MTQEGFLITSTTEFKKGQQVFINYGPHDDSFLFSEYGFVTQGNNNPYNHVLLDYDVEHLLSPVRKILESFGMYGDFTLSLNDLFSYRIMLALKILHCTKLESKSWVSYQTKKNYCKEFVFHKDTEKKAFISLKLICETKILDFKDKLNQIMNLNNTLGYFKTCGVSILSYSINILETVRDEINKLRI